MSKPIGNTEQLAEPVAARYGFDGYGYLYMDAGSGSDWASRVKDCEFLYTHPMSEWISVEDGFPKHNEEILGFEKLIFFGWYDNRFGFLDVVEECHREKTTHWMPLPNPPKVIK